jgi:hypothetical protein
MVVVGLIAFIITDLILAIAAFKEAEKIGFLFIFIPIYSIIYAFTMYVGNHRDLILTGWIVGPVIALVGGLILLFNNTLWEWVYY